MPWMNSLAPALHLPNPLSEAFLLDERSGLVTTTLYDLRAAFDFGRIASRTFFASLKCMAARTDSPEILVATIDPDPINYYHRNFESVPAFYIGSESTAEDFIHELNWDPDGGGADSIASHGDRVILLGKNFSWLILGERSFNLARLFVRRETHFLDLEDCLPIEWHYDRADILKCLLEADISSELAQETSNQLK